MWLITHSLASADVQIKSAALMLLDQLLQLKVQVGVLSILRELTFMKGAYSATKNIVDHLLSLLSGSFPILKGITRLSK